MNPLQQHDQHAVKVHAHTDDREIKDLFTYQNVAGRIEYTNTPRRERRAPASAHNRNEAAAFQHLTYSNAAAERKGVPAKTAQLDDVEPVRTPGRDAAAILVQLDRLKAGVPGGRRAGRRSVDAEGRHVPTGSSEARAGQRLGLWWGVGRESASTLPWNYDY